MMHTHSTDVQAVSALECGFIPLFQEAYMFHDRIGYHPFEGIVLDATEQERLVRSIGEKSHTLMLNNHGVITTGPDVAWAFMRMYQMIQGCQVQLKAMASGGKLLQASDEAIYYRLMNRIDPNWIR